MKTAELFALSCELSAFLSGTGSEQRAALRKFGLAFGTAYQVYDDCLDLFGSEIAAGKSLGTDLAKGKLTLPVLLAWERADAADRGRLQDLLQGWKVGSMKPMGRILARYQTLPASLEITRQYLEQARQVLRILPSSHARTGLLELTDYLDCQTGSLGIAPGNGL
jgi:octaprenyl-diphosphate synthase